MQDPYGEKHVTQMEILDFVSVSFLCPGIVEVAETFSFFLVPTSQTSDRTSTSYYTQVKKSPV